MFKLSSTDMAQLQTIILLKVQLHEFLHTLTQSLRISDYLLQESVQRTTAVQGHIETTTALTSPLRISTAKSFSPCFADSEIFSNFW